MGSTPAPIIMLFSWAYYGASHFRAQHGRRLPSRTVFSLDLITFKIFLNQIFDIVRHFGKIFQNYAISSKMAFFVAKLFFRRDENFFRFLWKYFVPVIFYILRRLSIFMIEMLRQMIFYFYLGVVDCRKHSYIKVSSK